MLKLLPFLRWIILMMMLCIFACGQQNGNSSAELTEAETAMDEAKYYSTDFVTIPDEIIDAVALGPESPEKALALEDVNMLIKPGYLDMENGYALLDDGSAYVAVKTDLPGATGDMIHWWFWWHALEDIRYKIWCPGDHYAIGVKNLDRYIDESRAMEKRYLNNPHYPVEDIGSGVMNLSIRFLSPKAFGFKTASFKRNGIEAVVCGIVGFRFGQTTIEHSYVCHVFRKKGDGLELRSRFWLGERINLPNLKKLVITEDLAIDMLMHCSKEFNHLAGFLPAIYDEFNQ